MLVFLRLRCVPSACRHAGDARHQWWFCGSAALVVGIGSCMFQLVLMVTMQVLRSLRLWQAHDLRYGSGRARRQHKQWYVLCWFSW